MPSSAEKRGQPTRNPGIEKDQAGQETVDWRRKTVDQEGIESRLTLQDVQYCKTSTLHSELGFGPFLVQRCPPSSVSCHAWSFSIRDYVWVGHAWLHCWACMVIAKLFRVQPWEASPEKWKAKFGEGKASLAQWLVCQTSDLKDLNSNLHGNSIIGLIYLYIYILIN